MFIDELAGRDIVAGLDPPVVLPGLSFVHARRTGKVLLLDTEGPTFAMRFGMTGGLLLDGLAGIDRLEYGPGTYEQRWIRAGVTFVDGGTLLLHDPRRLGRVLLDFDEDRLGPDAFDVTPAQLRAALQTRGDRPGPPLKARLLDQARLAGIGNLLADEILWRASLDPTRPCNSLSDVELRRLARQMRTTLVELYARGGSHCGDHMAERHRGGRCPKDGTVFLRQPVGGRTTYWCPAHQR